MWKQTSYFLSGILTFSLLGFSPAQKKEAPVLKEKKLTSWVNPFIGTAPLLDEAIIGYKPPADMRVWAGLVFPGSSLPNSMVQLSPMTRYTSGAGYEYENPDILGFTHTNKGHWNLCHIPLMPVPKGATYPYKSAFGHDQEEASPAYYQVYLKDYKVNVRLTSTLRAGIHEYTFENNANRQVLFDLGQANNHVDDWKLNPQGKFAVSGFQRTGHEKVYFYAELSEEIKEISETNSQKSKGYALLSLKDGTSPVVVKIGLSFVSETNAKQNVQKEIGNKTFDQIKKEGSDQWETLLGKIKIQGGTNQQKEMFYSSLYRSFLWPVLRSDSNGEFLDDQGRIRTESYKYYEIPSLWDDYRNKLVLLGMISPELTGDVISSLIDRGTKTGFIPTFFHGDHAAPFITGSYLRGIRNFDVKKGYEYLLNNAYKEGGTRPFLKEYIEKGYISDPDLKSPHVESKGKAGVSKTLEFAYDDYSLALLAKEMNDLPHYNDLMKRSKNYENVFDKQTNFMRGRLDDGRWITPFNPEYPYYEYMYREANAWNMSFFAPHDMPNLVKLYGGNQAFETKLDSLFTIPWNKDYIAWNISGFIGQYCHGNQPGHEAPFSYYFVGKPEKSQQRLDQIMDTMYGIGPEGLAMSGMDDAGEMSSWYVFTALGLYPLSPADPEYIVSVPLFEKSEWKLDNGKTIVIEKTGQGRDLKEIKVNKKKQDSYYVSHDLFTQGGTLTIKAD
ncbi:GH92 family glycosyl hydrolase [Chryseobacterium sp. A301]